MFRVTETVGQPQHNFRVHSKIEALLSVKCLTLSFAIITFYASPKTHQPNLEPPTPTVSSQTTTLH